MVKVLIFGLTLRHAVGDHEIEVEAIDPTTVKKLVEAHPDRLGAILPFIMNREVLVTVNKKVSTEDSLVKDGDVVKFSHQSRTSYDGTRDIPT
jgi:molybdopterin synthase sulfur carrier subunit